MRSALHAWLLETMAEHNVPVGMMIAPKLHEIFNYPGHGCSTGEVLQALIAMSNAGEVEFFRFGTGEICAPTLRELEQGPLRWRPPDGRLDCRLTRVGGEAWEKLAQPDWSRYMQVSWTSQGEDLPPVGMLECADLQCGLRALERRARVFVLPRARQFEPGMHSVSRPVVESIGVERVAPFKPTNWKLLPDGFQLTFTCDEASVSTEGLHELGDESWFRSMIPGRVDHRCAGL